MTLSGRLNAALKLPNGARFYRCALQVNPFAYLSRHSKHTPFRTEAEYNAAIIAACQEVGIEVIGVTDHYRVQESAGLVQAARAAGLFVFSGFEAVTKDGVHFLCLFDPDKDNVLERFIGECGIHDTKAASPTGSLDSTELLASVTVPTLVIAGAEDVLIPGGTSRTLARGIRGSRFETIAGAGHVAPLEQPGTTTELVRDFLESML